MTEKGERFMSVVLTACALLFAGVLVKREFIDRDSSRAMNSSAPSTAAPELVPNWDELRTNGLPVRSPDAPVVVVEFADLECPACKQFHSRLERISSELNADVGLIMVHFPLTIHRFAQPAARALECAHASGAGAAARFVDVAYAKQDSFGLKSWVSYAREAGVRDTGAFAACASDTAPVARVDDGRRLGESMNIRGTPLVIINGWRFAHVPNDTQLREALQALIRGKNPPGAAPVSKSTVERASTPN